MATTTPAPSLPTGRDWSNRAAKPFSRPGGMSAVTTGSSAVPDALAVARSAAPSRRPRSEGLMGAASMRTVTSCGAGSGASTVASESRSCPWEVTSERICRDGVPMRPPSWGGFGSDPILGLPRLSPNDRPNPEEDRAPGISRRGRSPRSLDRSRPLRLPQGACTRAVHTSVVSRSGRPTRWSDRLRRVRSGTGREA